MQSRYYVAECCTDLLLPFYYVYIHFAFFRLRLFVITILHGRSQAPDFWGGGQAERGDCNTREKLKILRLLKCSFRHSEQKRKSMDCLTTSDGGCRFFPSSSPSAHQYLIEGHMLTRRNLFQRKSQTWYLRIVFGNMILMDF